MKKFYRARFLVIILLFVFSNAWAESRPFEAKCTIEAEILSVSYDQLYYNEKDFHGYFNVVVRVIKTLPLDKNELAATCSLFSSEKKEVILKYWDWMNTKELHYQSGGQVMPHDNVKIKLAEIFVGESGWPSIIEIKRTSPAAVVVRLGQLKTNAIDRLGLCVALSFTNSSQPPDFRGVRVVCDALPVNGEKTIYGFKNGDGVAHIKLPTHDVMIENEAFSYVEAKMDRNENGMFTLYPERSYPVSYILKGVFYAQGHLFVINEIIHLEEERILYSEKQEARGEVL